MVSADLEEAIRSSIDAQRSDIQFINHAVRTQMMQPVAV